MYLNRLIPALMPALIGLLLGGPAQPAPAAITLERDGAVAIAGHTLRCGKVRNRLDAGLDDLGFAIPDRALIIINPALLSQLPETVRLFVFTHECGHHHVGGSELGADRWAVQRGLREGWLTRDGLKQVCRSFGNAPETSTHPSAARRCSNLERAFAAESSLMARELPRSQPAPEPATTRPAPGSPSSLVSGPKSDRAGSGS
jgi:hypothetical protein